MYDHPDQLYRLMEQRIQDEWRKAHNARLLHAAFPPRPLRARVAQLLQRLAARLDPHGAPPAPIAQDCT